MSEEEKRQRMMAKMMRGMTSGMNGPQQEFSEAPGQQNPEEFANVSFDTMADRSVLVSPSKKAKAAPAAESPMLPDLSNPDGGMTKVNNTASVKKKRWWE